MHAAADIGTADIQEVQRPRRRGSAVVATFAASVCFLLTLNFFLPRALPGNPIAALGTPTSRSYVSDAATRASLERYYGLDRPILEQFGHYAGGLVHGDLGVSTQYGASVTSVLWRRLPWTLLLVGTALAAAAAIGVLAGAHAGWRRGRRPDRGLLALFLAVDNIPVFFLGSLALAVFAVKLRWLPLGGATTPFTDDAGLDRTLDVGRHLLLPSAVLATQFVAFQFLVMRGAMITQLGADHLLQGRAKGLSERRLKYRYAARNALLPSVTVLALEAGAAISAAIFVETVFAYPGVGRLMVDAVATRDYALMQGCFILLSAVVLTFNLVADLAYRRLDPRSR